MHALICMSPKIKKASNSHLTVYFTGQPSISDEVLITLQILFIKDIHIGLYQFSAESCVKVNVTMHIQT